MEETSDKKEEGNGIVPDPEVVADADNSDAASDLSDEEPRALSPSPLPAANPDFDVQVHDDISHQTTPDDKETNGRKKNKKSSKVPPSSQNNGEPPPRNTGKIGRRHRKGRLLMRPVIVNERKDESTNLPRDHYETVLYRRAIRKPPNGTHSDSNDPKYDDNGDEIFGDTSLGMKLNIMGGKVIVQSLNQLSDGRASPAQLSGVIQRGDVLLQINGVSLVNLPIDQLMKGLGPLSTPDERTGAYQRTLSLRLASGSGLDLLRQAKGSGNDGSALGTEANSATTLPTLDPAADMFSLFPMVDNGRSPAKDNTPLQTPPEKTVEKGEEGTDTDKENESGPPPTPVPLVKTPSSLDEIIGERLAEERIIQRKKVISEFFSRKGGISMNLRYLEPGFVGIDSQMTENDSLAGLTPAEMIDIGIKALKGAKALSVIMERVDKGSDRRSFQSLSATLSLYSRASTRRRYVLDGRAMPVHFDKVQEAAFTEEEDDDDTNDSDNSETNSDEGEQLDGDELLLQLAATDEIWKKQVVDFLDHVIEQASEEHTEDSTQFDTNVDLSNELGSFLFGANMTDVLNRKWKSHVLPPPEITSLLFDLTTKISSTVPDRIKAEGDPITVRSSLVPFIGMKRPAADSNIMLANHFLLNQVLPLWLKSFRPLPLDQRRIMWPPESATLESTAGSTLSGDNDSLTIGSITARSSGVSRTRKNLREQIEDNELDPESRAETCFLTTYYFTQHLLPRLLTGGATGKQKSDEVLGELVDFVSQFGSYLRLHTCLAYAAVLKSLKLIDSLLEVAKFDPRHREVMKQTSRPSALIIYDSVRIICAAIVKPVCTRFLLTSCFNADHAFCSNAAIERYQRSKT
eukprot:scaffold190_cov171-Amphora_coffeaeformis.AAC.37